MKNEIDFYILETGKHFARETMTFDEAMKYAEIHGLYFERVKNPTGEIDESI